MQRMREDLVRRNYAESTIRSYLHTLEDFRRYAQRRLDHLGPDDIRRYLRLAGMTARVGFSSAC